MESNNQLDDAYQTSVTLTGRILRKKKFKRMFCLAVKEEEERNENDGVPNKAKSVLIPRGSPCLRWCLLGCIIRVDGTVDEKNSPDYIVANSDTNGGVELIQCAADPHAISLCLEMVATGDFNLDVFCRYNGLSSPSSSLPPMLESKEQAKLLQDLNGDERRTAINQIIRHLQGLPEKRQPIKRKPHVKRRHQQALKRMEDLIELEPIQQMTNPSSPNATPFVPKQSSSSFNLPNIEAMSAHGSISRVEYLQEKKYPQIQLMVRRLSTIQKDGKKFRHVLDVGGGRGDLAMAIAQAFPDVHVTIVDQNQSSLLAGREYYASMLRQQQTEQPGNMHFVCANFEDFCKDYKSPKNGKDEEHSDQNDIPNIDMVVALHACGDLSDLALVFAQQFNAQFLVCPCCYTKRYLKTITAPWRNEYDYVCQIVPSSSNTNTNTTSEPSGENQDLAAVQKLAEFSERPLLSHRAMRVINSLRVQSIRRQNAAANANAADGDGGGSRPQAAVRVCLEEYDNTYSKRNLVLVGEYE